MSGKKGQRRDDSYFAAARRKRKRAMIILIPIVAAVVAIAVVAGLMYSSSSPYGPFGPLNSEHEHAAFLVKLNGTNIDFSQDKYQVVSKFIHVEGNDGTTLHRHATGVPFGEFLRTVGMSVQEDCFVRDDGTRYCSQDNIKTRYFVNGTERGSIDDYVIKEGDRLLVIYGDGSDIPQALVELQRIEITTQ